LLGHLLGHGHRLRGASRRLPQRPVPGVDYVATGDLGGATDWRAALAGCDVVVHLAARVHVMSDAASEPLAEFRKVNTVATLNLARQAAAAGVRRFVFVSSVKVNGAGRDAPYCESDTPAPQDPYAISKWEAEQGLARIAAEAGLEVVILRPPLVYGPGVGANFLRLMQLVEKGWPLPFGRVDNRRSLLFLGNLVDAIRLCLAHPAAAGKTYLVSDGDAVATPELLRLLAAAMERRPRLLPLPASLIRLAGSLLGQSAEVSRLLDSLVLDSRRIREELHWRPPYTLAEGINQTVRAYLNG